MLSNVPEICRFGEPNIGACRNSQAGLEASIPQKMADHAIKELSRKESQALRNHYCRGVYNVAHLRA